MDSMTLLSSHLLWFRAVQVPATDLIVSTEHVHGHHADGESDGADDHLPGVGGHKEAMGSKKRTEHGETELWNTRRDTTSSIRVSQSQRRTGLHLKDRDNCDHPYKYCTLLLPNQRKWHFLCKCNVPLNDCWHLMKKLKSLQLKQSKQKFKWAKLYWKAKMS